MKKKKIIFMLINMNIGGTEKALLNLINELPKNKYEITIFMLEEYGGFLNSIPSEVKVKYFNGYNKIKDILNQPPNLVCSQLIKEGHLKKALIIYILHIITRVRKNRSLYFWYLLRRYSPLRNEYDIAVAYDGPMDFISYFVLKKIRAKKKFQWIHFDVSKIGFNSKFAASVYGKFDKVFVVSKEAREKLVESVPILKGKSEVLLNALSPDLILNQSKKGIGFTDKFNGLRILTVGRLSNEKGQDWAINVLARLVGKGYKVKWYCIGDGSSRMEYERMIKKNHLQEHFILLGASPNPYPYIEQCDIYVQPSRHEGYCITLAEARCLKRPIVTTEFTGAKEQITHRKTGLIVGINEDELFYGLEELILSKDLRAKFTRNLEREFQAIQNKNSFVNVI